MKLYLICIIFFYIGTIFYYKYKHKFWSTQPVSKFYNINFKEGPYNSIINKPFDIDLPYKLNYNNINYNKLVLFLNNNYFQTISYKFIYNNKLFEWLFKNNKSLNKIITIDYNNHYIGSISSINYNITINNINAKFTYVDYLCINKIHRNLSLVPKLITNIVNFNNINNIFSFIFKIENQPLPFNYICKMCYYQLDLSKYIINNVFNNTNDFISILTNKYIDNTYLFFNKFIKKYKIYPNYSLEEFKHLFLPNKNKNILSYIKTDKDNNIISFATFCERNIIMNNITSSCLEMIYFVDIHNSSDFINHLFNIFKNQFKYLLVLNIMDNDKFIKKFNFEKGIDCYYQLYNYHLFYPISPNNIGINFI